MTVGWKLCKLACCVVRVFDVIHVCAVSFLTVSFLMLSFLTEWAMERLPGQRAQGMCTPSMLGREFGGCAVGTSPLKMFLAGGGGGGGGGFLPQLALYIFAASSNTILDFSLSVFFAGNLETHAPARSKHPCVIIASWLCCTGGERCGQCSTAQ